MELHDAFRMETYYGGSSYISYLIDYGPASMNPRSSYYPNDHPKGHYVLEFGTGDELILHADKLRVFGAKYMSDAYTGYVYLETENGEQTFYVNNGIICTT